MNTRLVLLSVALLCIPALLPTAAAASQGRDQTGGLWEGADVTPAGAGRAEILASIRRRAKIKRCRLQCWVVRSVDPKTPRLNCRISCQN